jgi:hypothetical protein
MLAYILALIWALTNPAHNCHNHNHNHNNGQVTTLDDGDTGGETGPIKPKPPTNP